jgi:hypothetical protein
MSTVASLTTPRQTRVVIDPRGPRFVASATSVVLALVLLVPGPVAVVLLAFQTLVFAGVALAGLASGATAVFLVATALALVAALLNAVFGLCLGCELYLILRRATNR